jgi:hypothetical protein
VHECTLCGCMLHRWYLTLSSTSLQVEKRFPDKSAKLLVACSNGTQYSLEALEALDEVRICRLHFAACCLMSS